MNEAAAKARPRSIYRVADELCELYQQQIDTFCTPAPANKKGDLLE